MALSLPTAVTNKVKVMPLVQILHLCANILRSYTQWLGTSYVRVPA